MSSKLRPPSSEHNYSNNKGWYAAEIAYQLALEFKLEYSIQIGIEFQVNCFFEHLEVSEDKLPDQAERIFQLLKGVQDELFGD